MFITRLTLIAAISIVLSFAASAQQRILKLGTEGAYPPFNALTADGKLEGFDIDIGNALCAEMKVSCEWVTQEWDGMIPALQAGKFDIIMASMFITDEREKQVDFTRRYYLTPPAFAARKGSRIAGVDPQALSGKTLGVQSGTVYFDHLDKAYANSRIKAYPGVQEMQADLISGRVDAINDDIVVVQKFLETPEGECCEIIGALKPDPAIFGLGAGIAVRSGDPLRDQLNIALDAILANGVYKQINNKYFRFDVYGDAP
jgi:polar amino acid transport system substrate-binding protein